MKKNYHKLFVRLLVAVVALLLALAPGKAIAQWSVYDGGVVPDVLTPRPFRIASNTPVSPDVPADHQIIIPEPGIPSNNLLRMENTMPGTSFLWRMDFASWGGNPAIDADEFTVVLRVKGHAARTHALDFDMHYNLIRTRVSVNTADRLGRIRNGSGTNQPMPVPTTEWVIYRFAMGATQTRVFVNENPVPVMTITPAAVTGTTRHFRFGDGDSGATLGADIDWVIWDVSGAFAPGEGTPVPFSDLTPTWDVRLSDLKVGPTTIAGFNAAVTNYEVVLPVGTTEIPVITATANLSETPVTITQATTLPGVATIAVTSEDGLTTRTYLVHIRNVSANANLSAITVGGTALAGFDPAVTTYNVILPPETTTPPTVAATPADAQATVVVTQATAIPGSAAIVVTAEDGTTTQTYTINFRALSANANLSALTVQGIPMPNFDPATLLYSISLPFGTTEIPQIGATLSDPLASMVITQATAIPGDATIVVTAEDGTTTQTYTVNFAIEQLNWNLFHGEDSPEAVTPRPFVRATNNFISPDTFDDHNLIVPEPGIPSNNMLRMSNTMPGTQFLWRMNFAALTGPPAFPAIDVTNLTVVMRVKGHAGKTHALDLDLDYNGQRSRISVNTADRLGRIRNGSGTNRPMPVPTTEWIIYRIAMTATETRVFVNENPVPVMTFTPVTGSQRHFRFGDGDSGQTFGSDIDWVIWDITGAFAPGEGTPVPFSDLTPVWDVRLSDLQVAGTQVAGFHPAVTNYEVVYPVGTTEIPQIDATADLPGATVTITQATTLPGVATVAVASADGLTTRTYLVHIRTVSANANLSAITVGGTALANFDPAVATYDMVLPVATTTPPTVAATLADIKSTMVITQATAIPGAATIVVTAEDGTTVRTYTINFRLQSENANLSEISVGGTAISGFSPDVLIYNVELPAGTTIAPTVTAVLADPNAGLLITQASAIPGSATIVVTAEAGNQKTYEVNFTRDVTSIYAPAENLFKIFPNPATNSLNLNWGGNARAEVEIFNLVGHSVLRKTVESNSTRLDIGHLPAGVYIIKLKSGQYEVRQTFIKQQH